MSLALALHTVSHTPLRVFHVSICQGKNIANLKLLWRCEIHEDQRLSQSDVRGAVMKQGDGFEKLTISQKVG